MVLEHVSTILGLERVDRRFYQRVDGYFDPLRAKPAEDLYYALSRHFGVDTRPFDYRMVFPSGRYLLLLSGHPNVVAREKNGTSVTS